MKTTIKVKHIKQMSSSACGAACLAMIYEYFGDTVDQNNIWDRLKKKRPLVEGDFYIDSNADMKDATKNGYDFVIGRSYWDIKDAFQPIEQFLRSGIPVSVTQQGHPDPKLGHCRVVVGLDEKHVFVNDPEKDKGNTKMTRKEFFNAWEESGDEVTGGVMMVIFPKGTDLKTETLLLDDVTSSVKLDYKTSQ